MLFTVSSPQNRTLGLACLMAASVQSVFFRSYIATLTPVFVEEFGLTPQQIGALSTSFFVAYAVGHLPAAVALDRFGVGRVVGPLLVLGACATYGVSVAASPMALIVAQALLGLGCSASFVGLFHYAARFHHADRFVSLANLGSALGLGGGIIASLPLSAFAGAFGWRAALAGAACAMLATALVVFLAVRDQPAAGETRPLDVATLFGGLRRVILLRPLWPIFGIFLIVPAVPTFRTAWGGQYLNGVFGADLNEIGVILLVSNLISFGIMFGGSFIPAKVGSREVIYGGICATIATLVVFAFLGAASKAAAAILFGLISLGGVPHMYLLGRVRALLPPDILGLGLGLSGSVIFIGFAATTAASGWLLGFAAGQGLSVANSFMLVFLIAALAIAVATLCCSLAVPRSDAKVQPKLS